MLSDPWQCAECRLEVCVGMFHGRGYFAKFLVCRSCGTTHAIEEAPEKKLLTAGGPYFPEPADDQPRVGEGGNEFVTITWCPFNWIPVAQEVGQSIADLVCDHCGRRDLTEEWDTTMLCPSCSAPMTRKFQR